MCLTVLCSTLRTVNTLKVVASPLKPPPQHKCHQITACVMHSLNGAIHFKTVTSQTIQTSTLCFFHHFILLLLLYFSTKAKVKSSQVKSSKFYCQFFHMYSTYIQRIEIALLSDPWCIQLTLNTDSRHLNTDKYSLTICTYKLYRYTNEDNCRTIKN